MAAICPKKVPLRECLALKSCQLVDVRDSSLYNGWSGGKLECSGGHLPGAVLLCHSWICGAVHESGQYKGVTWDDLLSYYIGPGFHSASTELALYGHGIVCKSCGRDIAESSAEWLLTQFPSLNYRLVVATSEHPVTACELQDIVTSTDYARLPMCSIHVSAEWLDTSLKTRTAGSLIVLHAGWDDWSQFAEAHIPTAQYVDMMKWEDPETMDHLSADACLPLLAELGLSAECEQDTSTVLYDCAVGIGAGRLGVILWSLGFVNLHLLSGGLHSWTEAGFETNSSGCEAVLRKSSSPAMIPLLPSSQLLPMPCNTFVDIGFVRKVISGHCPNSVLVSCCSWREYVGQSSGYSYISPKGRIPGARWVLSGSCKDDLWHWHDNAGLPTNWFRIAELYNVAGIDPSKHVILYCGTGWRCSAVWFYLRALGYSHVSVYDGGWFEWSAEPANPVEIGLPDAPWFSRLKGYLPPSMLLDARP